MGRPRLLVLAIDRAIGELICSMLRLRGHDCIEVAGGGAEALALARTARLDLALVDLRDGMREPASLRAARLLEWSLGVPSLFLSAAPQLLRPGFDGCGVLEKPLRSETLTASVKAATTMLRTGEVPDDLPRGLRLWLPAGGPRRIAD